MTKNKLLTFAVIVLFNINIITLSFLFFKGPRPNERPKQRPSEIVIDILDFDEQQIIEYKKLIDKHSSQINDLDQKINETKNKLYLELASQENKSKKDSILSILNTYKSEVEQAHYNHFLDIKKICKPEQLENYNRLILELSSIFAPPPINHKNDK